MFTRYFKNQLWYQDKCCACCTSSIDQHYQVCLYKTGRIGKCELFPGSTNLTTSFSVQLNLLDMKLVFSMNCNVCVDALIVFCVQEARVQGCWSSAIPKWLFIGFPTPHPFYSIMIGFLMEIVCTQWQMLSCSFDQHRSQSVYEMELGQFKIVIFLVFHLYLYPDKISRCKPVDQSCQTSTPQALEIFVDVNIGTLLNWNGGSDFWKWKEFLMQTYPVHVCFAHVSVPKSYIRGGSHFY